MRLGIDFIAFDAKMAKRIVEAGPTMIGMIDGLRYFENPFYGDESPLIVIINGTWYESHEWEV